jgi:hypothetical protein
VFFSDHVFDDRALFLGEALRQPVDNGHQGPHFGFFCHSQSFDPPARRVNHHLVVPRQRPKRRLAALRGEGCKLQKVV